MLLLLNGINSILFVQHFFFKALSWFTVIWICCRFWSVTDKSVDIVEGKKKTTKPDWDDIRKKHSRDKDSKMYHRIVVYGTWDYPLKHTHTHTIDYKFISIEFGWNRQQAIVHTCSRSSYHYNTSVCCIKCVASPSHLFMDLCSVIATTGFCAPVQFHEKWENRRMALYDTKQTLALTLNAETFLMGSWEFLKKKK